MMYNNIKHIRFLQWIFNRLIFSHGYCAMGILPCFMGMFYAKRIENNALNRLKTERLSMAGKSINYRLSLLGKNNFEL